MFKGYNIMKFCKTFNTDNDCFNYLTYIKWENGFQCPKCNHTGWCKTKLNHIRKCNRCKHKTSATAGTLFHKVKFPIQQAFMIVFLVSSSRKGNDPQLGSYANRQRIEC